MERQIQRKRRKRGLALAFLALTLGLLLLSGPALAENKTWIVNNGWWSTATNWNPSGVPIEGDDVYLTQSGGTNKIVSYRMTAPSAPLLHSLNIDATGVGAMTLNQGVGGNSYPLASLNEYIGINGSGTHLQSLGTNTISFGLYLGFSSPGAHGTYALSGGSLSAANQYLGYMTGTTGTMNQSGGSNTASSNLFLGSNTDTTGTYTLSGATSSLSAGNVYLGSGSNSIATFTQSDATTNIAGSLNLSTGFNSLSTYTLNSGSLSAANVYVGTGFATNATFNQFGGTSTTQMLAIGGGGGGGSANYSLQSGTLNVTDTVNLNSGGLLGLNTPGGAVLNFKTFNQMGGQVNGGVLTNNPGSQYNYWSGVFNGRLVNYGTAEFNADFHAPDGIDNHWRISESDRNFTLDGFGLNNQGTFALYNGSIGGNGPVVNSGAMSVGGDITGSGGFTNFGFFTVNGRLGLSKTGTNINYGQMVFQSDWDQQLGQEGNPLLQLSGNSLINRGLINMTMYNMANTIFITGGTLTNDVGGIIQGKGIITGNFSNAGLMTLGGTMQIYKDFTNTGIIQLGYSSEGGSGGSILMGGQTNGVPSGAITNLGKITGSGIINSNISSNSGVIESGGYGGSLVLNGSVANNAGGLITAKEGAITVTQGLAVNGGRINLEGGVFDNNNHSLTNTNAGQISGFGTFRTGGTDRVLLNYGKINLTGNLAWTTVVNGAVNNGDAGHTGARMDLSSYVYFSDLVTNYSGNTVKTYGVGDDLSKATLTFAGGFVNSGTYISDPIIQSSTKDLENTATGVMIGGPDDGWMIGGSFINRSIMNQEWETSQSSLIFADLGYGTAHDLYLAGADLDNSRQGYLNNFAFGTLDILDQVITLLDGNADNSGTAFYAGLLLGAILDDGKVTNIDGNGFNLYYDPLLAGNQYLGGGTYALGDGGFLAPVTESAAMMVATPVPPTVWMVLSGLAGLGLLRRRKVNQG